jgi:hypothetical protein
LFVDRCWSVPAWVAGDGVHALGSGRTLLVDLFGCVRRSTLTFAELEWHLGPLSPNGELSSEGRLILTVLASTACALISVLVTRAPDPATLVPFYRRLRPIGAWGPVRALASATPPHGEFLVACIGSLGSLAATLAHGFWLLERDTELQIALVITVVGMGVTVFALRRLGRVR